MSASDTQGGHKTADYLCNIIEQPQRNTAKMHKDRSFLHNKAPRYLVDCCVPVSDIASRQRLRSARRCLLTVPRHQRSRLGRLAFSVTGPTVWNLLPDQLRDSNCTESTSRQSLKTFFFNRITTIIVSVSPRPFCCF